MKNIILLTILIICFQPNLFGQDFKKSKTISLSKVDTTSIKLSNGEDSYKRTVYLKDSNNKRIKEFKVSLDSYSDEESFVEEITETQLKNINKIVRVSIEHCACYCNLDIYYWLVTNDNEWIELPTIEQGDLDIGNTYLDYTFKKENKEIIELVEFREKINKNKPNKHNLVGYEIERVYEKKLKNITWNGNELQGLEKKYIVTAQNGLLLRNKPSLNGVKKGKIYFGAQVTIISRTRFTQTITDKGKKIKGNWVKVQFKNHPIQISTDAVSNIDYGYVFDGYLEKMTTNIDRITRELMQFNEFENLKINESKSPFYLEGDFYGDGINDIAVLLENKAGATKIGIINYNKNNSLHILGNLNNPSNEADYGWTGIFKKVDKGVVLWSNYEDDFVDFKDVPENKKVKLKYNSLYLHASESCGGGFIYWKNGKFNWLQQE